MEVAVMPDMNEFSPVEILLVEDNPGDALLTKQHLKKSKVCNTLHVVEDGVSAMAFLRREGLYAGAPRPDMILLDLNIPRKDGREVLAEVKADEDLRLIPVIVFTSSESDEDILKCYRAHANCYITKPIDFEQFCRVINSIEEFWFMIVRRPPQGKKDME
jgi:two-component system, chemotaxis family, response regulator Rcp1